MESGGVAFTVCVCERINIMDGVKLPGPLTVGPIGDPGGGMNDGGLAAGTGFDSDHSSCPLVPSLAAKTNVVPRLVMALGFEPTAPGRISLTKTVVLPAIPLLNNSRPFTPSSAEKNNVLL